MLLYKLSLWRISVAGRLAFELLGIFDTQVEDETVRLFDQRTKNGVHLKKKKYPGECSGGKSSADRERTGGDNR